jgi:hypothetical protein
MEIWKDIEGHSKYEVSSLGRIRRLYKIGYKFRKPVIQFGYVNVTFSLMEGRFKKYQVHRLVAIAFLENKENKLCVNHIDGNKSNNNVNNLEWCTHSENEQHSFDVLKKVSNGIIRRKIDLKEIHIIKKMKKDGITQRSIAKKYNVSEGVISLIINNKSYIKHV